MGFTWFAGYRTFWREGWAGTRGRNLGEELRQHGGALCAGLLPWIAQLPFLYYKVAPTVICTLNEQSHGNTPTDPAQASPMEAVPTLRFPFPRCVKVPTEAKCAGCRGKDSKAWGWGTRILGSILKFNKCEINSFTGDVISVL